MGKSWFSDENGAQTKFSKSANNIFWVGGVKSGYVGVQQTNNFLF